MLLYVLALEVSLLGSSVVERVIRGRELRAQLHEEHAEHVGADRAARAICSVARMHPHAAGVLLDLTCPSTRASVKEAVQQWRLSYHLTHA